MDEIKRLLGERREGRVAAEHADDHADPEPGRQMMAVDEDRDGNTDEKAAGRDNGV